MGDISNSLETDLKQALKERDSRKVSVLRMLKTALVNERIAKMHDLAADEEIAVIRRELKKREDSIASFRTGGREDRAAEEEAEAEMLRSMLPAELSDEEIKAVVEKVVAEQGGDNFGKVMGLVMKEVGARASGDRVKIIVQAELSK